MNSDGVSYLRGAFIAYEPGGYPNGSPRTIPFRFNPETLSRSLQVEQGKGGSGTSGSSSKSGGSSDQGADASAGIVKETFSVVVRVDFRDRHESAQNLPPEVGVAPELAALEDLLYGTESPSDANSDGKEPVKQRPQRPTVLFVWGLRRVLPVKITSLKINETLFNTELAPTRAEVEVAMEVLSELDAKDNRAVSDALSFTAGKRRELARQYLETTADQASKVPRFQSG